MTCVSHRRTHVRKRHDGPYPDMFRARCLTSGWGVPQMGGTSCETPPLRGTGSPRKPGGAAPTSELVHVLPQYELHLCNDAIMATAAAPSVHNAASWRERYWHNWALATNHLEDGVRRLPRDRALQHRYIETGPGAMTICVVIDVDHPLAAIKAFESPADHPKPSWVAEGPTGHAHVGWWLNEPVTRTEAARQAPIRYLAVLTGHVDR